MMRTYGREAMLVLVQLMPGISTSSYNFVWNRYANMGPNPCAFHSQVLFRENLHFYALLYKNFYSSKYLAKVNQFCDVFHAEKSISLANLMYLIFQGSMPLTLLEKLRLKEKLQSFFI